MLTRDEELNLLSRMFADRKCDQLTDADRAAMQADTHFIACGQCGLIYPDDGIRSNPYFSDHCKRCDKGFFALQTKSQQGLFENPLFDAFVAAHKNMGMSVFMARHFLTHTYSWAVPNEDVILAIKKYSPLLEIGAGRGYWAWMLQQAGADIIAYDKFPPSERENSYHLNGQHCYTEVLRGGTFPVTQHQDRALFLCWPPMSRMARNALRRYKGELVVFIGESKGGCTADEGFFDEIDEKWEELECVDLPQYYGIHDRLTVFKRK